MKKTLTINISSIIFHIDDDAYEMLKNYLGKINARFSASEEGKEIIADIEARIAELFSERLKDKKQVVCIADVENMIERMGDPDDFVDEEDQDENEPEAKRTYKKPEFKVGKRLYRDPENRMVGGVAGGIAAYFGIDPVIVRILFIISAFFQVGVIAYIIFWIAVPVARTTAQKLEMQGKRVTVSNIEQSISEEFTEVKDNFRKFRRNKSQEKTREFVEPIVSSIGAIAQIFVKIIVVIIGISFLFVGFAFILGLFGTIFIDGWVFAPLDLSWITAPEILSIVADSENVKLLIIGVILLAVLPILGIIYGGFRLIFNFKTNNRVIGFSGFILWIIALFLVISITAIEGKRFRNEAVVKQDIPIEEFASPVIYLEMANDTIDEYSTDVDEFFEIDEARLIYDDKYRLFIRPEIDIEKSTSGKIEIIERRSSRGNTRKEARYLSDEIIYSVNQNDSLFSLDAFFEIGKDSKYRVQELEVIFKLPLGQRIFINENLNDIVWNSNYTGGVWAGDLLGSEWVMTEDGLKEVSK